jgi:hypothetical protein
MRQQFDGCAARLANRKVTANQQQQRRADPNTPHAPCALLVEALLRVHLVECRAKLALSVNAQRINKTVRLAKDRQAAIRRSTEPHPTARAAALEPALGIRDKKLAPVGYNRGYALATQQHTCPGAATFDGIAEHSTCKFDFFVHCSPTPRFQSPTAELHHAQ